MSEFDELKKKISEDPSSFVIILGAGASIPAGLPSWIGLRDILCDSIPDVCEVEEECEIKKREILNARSLWDMFKKLRVLLGATLYEKRISLTLDPNDLKTPLIYHKLWKLNPAGIIDFNIDRLAVNAYSELFHTGVDYATSKEPHKFKNFPSANNKFVFFPHGFVQDSSSWVFTTYERKRVYSDSNFLNIMTTLLNSKNLLIIGFNANEWSFRSLLTDIGIAGQISGYHNYYLCPDASDEVRRTLDRVGISVISYHPSSAEHKELDQLLDTLLLFHSTDEPLPSVYTGKKYTESEIPSASECYKYSVDDLRKILNGVVANIIPYDQVPTEDQLKKLEIFYNTYIVQLHRAWLVDPRSPDTNSVYHYTANRFIGNGAFGSVYEAENEKGERYALKVLLPDVKDKISYLSCFRRGIRSMKILTERKIPGMVKIYDSYEVPACIVMDLVDGITLREAVDKRFLTRLDIKLKILNQIATIIHQAHQLEERVLHRDLKPENIMLEYCYSQFDFDDSNNIPSIKILDFDLSWHRGATEKTVMFGAISQGFMAPEQTDPLTDNSLSRNTAVDVYSLGMLSYYVLTGLNPLPNESLFNGFSDKLLKNISDCDKFVWKSLPYFLSDTIFRATEQLQTSRISMGTFISNLEVAIKMHLNQTISNTHPLLLLELRKRIDDMGDEEISDFGRTISINYPQLSKRIRLSTQSIRNKIVLAISIERYLSSFDQREGINKYFQAKKERALSQVDKSIFSIYSAESSRTDIVVQISGILPDNVSLDYIDRIATNIRNIRSSFDI